MGWKKVAEHVESAWSNGRKGKTRRQWNKRGVLMIGPSIFIPQPCCGTLGDSLAGTVKRVASLDTRTRNCISAFHPAEWGLSTVNEHLGRDHGSTNVHFYFPFLISAPC